MAIERIVPGTWEWTAFYGNHIHRYQFAAELLAPSKPKRILDIACGIGYGSDYLRRQLDAEVIGIDKDGGSIAMAQQSFAASGARFEIGQAEALDTMQNKFDAIVSFETIEHLARPELFLQHCHELLVPGGTFIGSTPNSFTTANEFNEFHLREFTPGGLQRLMWQSGFQNLAFFGQVYTATGFDRNARRAAQERADRAFWRRALRIVRRLVGRPPSPALPEQVEDFQMIPLLSMEACDALKQDGPSVIMVVATR